MKNIALSLVASLLVSSAALAASTGEVMVERSLRAHETPAMLTVEESMKKPVAKRDLAEKSKF